MQITVRQAANLLGTSERQLYRWIEEGEIPFCRVNDQLRFDQTELLEWATARRIPVSSEIFHNQGDGKPVPLLAEALRSGGVHHHLPGKDRHSVLHAVVDRMPLGKDVDREFLLQVLLAREASGLTGIGDGIAIPHVHNPVVLNGVPASVALCTLDKPVDFTVHDGEPVHSIFFIVSPTVGIHLQILAKLASALHDGEFRIAIVERAPAADLLEHAHRLDRASTLASSGERQVR